METANAQTVPHFRRYANQGGHSGVAAYALVGSAGIAVRFVDGAVYLYDRACPGPFHVARMKALAREGKGLAAYISRRVGRRYAARLDETARPGGSPGVGYETRQKTAFR
jgi:hypothetical protein